MIQLRRSEERGHADHGWLDARHTFSFAGYLDPRHMGFSALRVLNQDRIAPGAGFPTHPHRDMEIVTCVLEGALRHRDSLGNGSVIRPGEVQYMSAGRGVEHSEANASQEQPVHVLQMWVLPRSSGGEPRYDQRAFPPQERSGRLRLAVSPDGRDGSIRIEQDAALYLGLLAAGERVEHALEPGRSAWLHVARGRLRLGDEELGPGDGAGLRDEPRVLLEGLEQAELVLWDLP